MASAMSSEKSPLPKHCHPDLVILTLGAAEGEEPASRSHNDEPTRKDEREGHGFSHATTRQAKLEADSR
jgi:hypothetical protein